jgi:ribosomal protein S12 methylthiotransferase accessory factor YcaO
VATAAERWQTAASQHDAAVRAFIDTAERLPEERWNAPVAPEKWSPAQITEHLALAYEAVLREITGGPAMAPRAGAWQQRLLRWFVLPHILFHRKFPRGARAPRETRPLDGNVDRGAALHRLREVAERAQRELWDAERRGMHPSLTHPYFGSIDGLRALRFSAVHVEHHRRQISG